MSTAVAPAPSFDFASLPFEEKLDRFAKVAVHVGLNLQAGQELLISASIEMLPLVRRLVRSGRHSTDSAWALPDHRAGAQVSWASGHPTCG